MTKVRHDEGTEMKNESHTRVKVKRRGPLTPINQRNEMTSTSGSQCFLQHPDQSPWSSSLDVNRLPLINDSFSPRGLNFTISALEPNHRARASPAVPAILPEPRRSPPWANQSSTSQDKRPHQDFDFNSAVLEVFNNIDNISRAPLFKQLDKPALYDDKTLRTIPRQTQRRTLTMEKETKDRESADTIHTKQIMQFVREKEAALDEVKKAKAELTETQSKLYDAMKLIEELEKKVPADKNKKPKNAKKAPPPKKKPNASPGTPDSKGGTSGKDSSQKDGLYHPPVDDIDPGLNSREYYWKLAESFPTLPMMHVLDAEKKFMDADCDSSGCIDKDELDKVLCDTVGLFTPKQVEVIFNEVDTNHSESVDFYEVLVILNKLYNKRRTNLPQSVQQNYSKTCNIQ